MSSYTNHYHTIVIGIGGMGSATLYQLAKRGHRVLGLEQFDIPHTRGSSHGLTRIIRLVYQEHPTYVQLLYRAYALWDELEQLTGEKVLYRVGSLDIGSADSSTFTGSLRAATEYDIPHELYSGRELRQRWPAYQFPHDIMALYHREGGYLTPEQAIIHYANMALALGAELHGREQLLAWEPVGDGVRVYTDRDTYEAERLVFTSGAWNAQLLPILQGLAVPERQVLSWTQPLRPELYQPDRFPVFNCDVPQGRFYGFPVHGIPGFKLGCYHHFGEQGEVEAIRREPDYADEELMREFISLYFPTASGPTLSLTTCLFTNSPDGHFIIDLYPGYPQVSFAAGFSGHGYKFASVMGEIMADLAERQSCRHDLSFFSLARFTGQLSQLYRDKWARLGQKLAEEVIAPWPPIDVASLGQVSADQRREQLRQRRAEQARRSAER